MKYILTISALLLTSCSWNYTQRPDGEIHFTGLIIIPVDEESGK
jgi:hypothetical protein